MRDGNAKNPMRYKLAEIPLQIVFVRTTQIGGSHSERTSPDLNRQSRKPRILMRRERKAAHRKLQWNAPDVQLRLLDMGVTTVARLLAFADVTKAHPARIKNSMRAGSRRYQIQRVIASPSRSLLSTNRMIRLSTMVQVYITVDPSEIT
jgi:tRNA A37 N6-isopentenylltransferase MiaA